MTSEPTRRIVFVFRASTALKLKTEMVVRFSQIRHRATPATPQHTIPRANGLANTKEEGGLYAGSLRFSIFHFQKQHAKGGSVSDRWNGRPAWGSGRAQSALLTRSSSTVEMCIGLIEEQRLVAANGTPTRYGVRPPRAEVADRTTFLARSLPTAQEEREEERRYFSVVQLAPFETVN